MKPIFTWCVALCLLPGLAQSQLVVNNSSNPDSLVEAIFLSNGIFTSNLVYNGQNEQFGSFDGSASNLGINEGIVLSSGAATAAADGVGYLPNMGPGGDPDLEALTGYMTYDLATLEFDFLATGDSMNFRFVFGSNEYPEWVGSSFNDVFGFFVSGPGISGTFTNDAVNIATVPGTGDYISVNTINADMNSAYYVDNAGWSTMSVDAYTIPMNASIGGLTIGESYHIKIAVTDVSDGALDTWVFLGGDSFEQFCTVNLLADQDRGGPQCMLSNVHAMALNTETCGTIELINQSEMNVDFTNAYYTMGNDVILPVTADVQSYTYDAEGQYLIWLVYEVGEFRTQSFVGAVNIAFEAPDAPEVLTSQNHLEITNYAGVDPLPSFQWYLNGEAIDGATGLSLDITESGVYSVSANGGCLAWSDEFNMEFVGIRELGWDALNIYPNPSEGRIQIRWNGAPSQAILTDVSGREVRRMTLNGVTTLEEELGAGSYVLRVFDEADRVIAVRQCIVY